MGIIIMFSSIMIIINVYLLFLLFDVNSKIANLRKKVDSLDEIETDVEMIETYVREYEKLCIELEMIKQKNSNLTATNEYLKGVCDDAKEELEKLNK